MDMRDDGYMARYFDDLERELALVFEDIEDDGDRDDVVRQLQDYVMYQNSVLSMSPLACVKYYEASYHVYNFLMNLLISYDALLTDLVSACFKLRLNKCHKLAVIFEQFIYGGHYLTKGNKRHITTCKVEDIIDVLSRNVSNVGFLHTFHTIIITKSPVKLAVSHINRIHK